MATFLLRTLCIALFIATAVGLFQRQFQKLAGTPRTTVKTIPAHTENMLRTVTLPQGKGSRKTVEGQIEALRALALSKPSLYKKPIVAGAWRTVWTTVTADNVLGVVTRSTPQSVIGGIAWQIFSNDMKTSENIVYWKSTGLRMAGKADIQTFKNQGESLQEKFGYFLLIRGLDFRLNGKKSVPEAAGVLGEPAAAADEGKGTTIVALNEKQAFSNGYGKLDVIYNDGIMRITEDTKQKLTYIHLRESVIESSPNEVVATFKL